MAPVIDEYLTAELIWAADRPDATSVIANYGATRVALALLAEAADRAKLLAGPASPVPVQFDLGFDGERLPFVLTLGQNVPGIEPGRDDDALVVIRQDLTELLRSVYDTGNHCATRELLVKDSDTPHGLSPDDPWVVRRRAAVLAAHQAVEAISRRFTDLTELAIRFDADKWGGHWYTQHYQRYFEPLRDKRVKVLEIGIGGYDDPDLGGASLRMWKHYFWRGQVFGVDIAPKTGVAESRLRTLQGDQGDADFLEALAAKYGPFDIVIDDGSHFSEHVITSCETLFPHVRPGGLYVIEDLQSSYWPGWGGSTDATAPHTSMGFVKTLVDGLNHQEQIRPGDEAPSAFERTVTGVHLHHNIAVLERGVNSEQGAPSWVPRVEDPRVWYSAD